MNKLTRKDRIINALIVVSVLVVGFVVWYLPPAIAYWRSSDVYKRYSRVEGVRATYIKDFPLNDTLTVAVTLLEATDSAGWERLKEGFAVIPIPPEVLAYCDSNTIDVWLAAKHDYSLRADSVLLNNDLIAMNYMKHIISVFILESVDQKEAILHYQAKSLTPNTKLK